MLAIRKATLKSLWITENVSAALETHSGTGPGQGPEPLPAAPRTPRPGPGPVATATPPTGRAPGRAPWRARAGRLGKRGCCALKGSRPRPPPAAPLPLAEPSPGAESFLISIGCRPPRPPPSPFRLADAGRSSLPGPLAFPHSRRKAAPLRPRSDWPRARPPPPCRPPVGAGGPPCPAPLRGRAPRRRPALRGRPQRHRRQRDGGGGDGRRVGLGPRRGAPGGGRRGDGGGRGGRDGGGRSRAGAGAHEPLRDVGDRPLGAQLRAQVSRAEPSPPPAGAGRGAGRGLRRRSPRGPGVGQPSQAAGGGRGARRRHRGPLRHGASRRGAGGEELRIHPGAMSARGVFRRRTKREEVMVAAGCESGSPGKRGGGRAPGGAGLRREELGAAAACAAPAGAALLPGMPHVSAERRAAELRAPSGRRRGVVCLRAGRNPGRAVSGGSASRRKESRNGAVSWSTWTRGVEECWGEEELCGASGTSGNSGTAFRSGSCGWWDAGGRGGGVRRWCGSWKEPLFTRVAPSGVSVAVRSGCQLQLGGNFCEVRLE